MTTTPDRVAERVAPIGLLGAFIAMFGWAASGILAKAIDLDSLVVVAYRFWIGSIGFFAYLTFRKQGFTAAKFKIALPGGLGLAFDVAFFFSAVKLTAVANATVIVALQPMLMIYLGSRLLGERITRQQVMWSVVALAGVAVLLFGSAGLPEADWRGDLLAFCAVFAWTAYLYFSKASQGALSPTEYTAYTALITALVNTPLLFLFRQNLEVPSFRDAAYLLLMVLGSGLAAHLLMNWSLTKIPVWVGSTMTLLIPAGSTVMAWLFLDESITVVQMLGISLTLLALGAIALNTRTTP